MWKKEKTITNEPIKDINNSQVLMNVHHISWGLFDYNGVSFWRKIKYNIKDFFTFLGRVKYVLKNGYSPVAKWETDAWFVCVMREILIKYNEGRFGYPGRFAECENGDELWENEIKRAVCLLEEYYTLWDGAFDGNTVEAFKERNAKMEEIKKEFFKWFSDNLEDLWD